MEVIECNTEVAMETIGEAAESRFTSPNKIVVDQLKLKEARKGF